MTFNRKLSYSFKLSEFRGYQSTTKCRCCMEIWKNSFSFNS